MVVMNNDGTVSNFLEREEEAWSDAAVNPSLPELPLSKLTTMPFKSKGISPSKVPKEMPDKGTAMHKVPKRAMVGMTKMKLAGAGARELFLSKQIVGCALYFASQSMGKSVAKGMAKGLEKGLEKGDAKSPSFKSQGTAPNAMPKSSSWPAP